MFKEVVEKLKKFNPFVLTGAFYAFSMVSDWVSSLLNNANAAVYETNPFTRNELGRFVLLKAIEVDGIFLVALLICGRVIYLATKEWNESAARVVSCWLFIYFASIRLTGAVIPNILLALKFYTPTIPDILRELLNGV